MFSNFSPSHSAPSSNGYNLLPSGEAAMPSKPLERATWKFCLPSGAPGKVSVGLSGDFTTLPSTLVSNTANTLPFRSALISDARLGLIPGQVQVDSAKAAGVEDGQIILFKDQSEVIAALQAGTIDAFAATALGNSAIAGAHAGLESVAHAMDKNGKTPVGAFSFSKTNQRLLQAVNKQLRVYLGSADHRARVAKYGITATEIDGVVAHEVAQSQ
ncbi:hypothetical protein PSTG_18087 [Puccinia striiformis f. sp. tritici PST-78]|uniref:Uncharacterized protein n=1 Tax=Puccinia striiformis f. sp. tritici PST-78 TaxID=1165861 RepID=A0A0L0UP29_9BASI|nr:hypothetical protein PSTG_18087 [Puccinia striiformis f. sp. tritici PST-78]